jgi:hypothetical protein
MSNPTEKHSAANDKHNIAGKHALVVGGKDFNQSSNPI